jgi:glycosyltransferase involved in cell wall biosynthesis
LPFLILKEFKMKYHTLIIDALVYKKYKAFGFQEYLFNLLDYFHVYRTDILCDRIIVICDITQLQDFKKYEEKFEIIGYKIPNLFYRFIIQSYVPFKLDLDKSDVILNLCNYSSLIKRCKHILVVHDLLYLRKDLLKNFLMRTQRKIYIPRSLLLADVIIAISEFTKDDILQNFKISPKTYILKIYNYFNFNKFKIDIQKTKMLIEGNYFLCVSSSEFHKNTITILKAFEKYCIQNEDSKLCIVGSIKDLTTFSFYEQLNPNVKERIQIFSNISNSELGLLYERCQAFISATFFEGLGMPIIEAMYFNAQLILSDIQICREVTNNQAVFFDPYSFEDLFDKMVNFKKEITNSYLFELEKFSPENTSQKYIDVINKL